MGSKRRTLGLAVLQWILAGCTPHNPRDTEEQSAASPAPTPAVSAAPPPTSAVDPAPASPPIEPAAAEAAPTAEKDPPPLAAEATTPSIDIRVQARVENEVNENPGCVSTPQVRNVPAYDPEAERVLVVETYQRKMSDQREFDLVWYDAKTGAETRREDLLAEESERHCARSDRKARLRSRTLNEELAAGRWEAMTRVPIRRVHEDAYDNLRGGLNELEGTDEDAEELRESLSDFADALMPRGQVHVVTRHDGTVVRLPGVKVYERNVDIRPNILADLVGHRPSGIVVATHADCRDEEDCTCNLEETTVVMQWSPATLAAIETHPCEFTEHDRGDEFACILGSIFDG
ncbi:MAG: hypothetical protein ACRBN8_34055 [Nannocystales bacterium]